jgi:hypothetical protein
MNLTHTLFSLVACALLLAPTAGAQDVLSLEGVETVRDASELQDLLSPPPDRDSVDTAIVFSNDLNRPAHVGCVGFDGDGQFVGHAWLRVPARGLRFVLASDLSSGSDFIGSVRCWTPGRAIIGSAFLLGPSAVTDLPIAPPRAAWQSLRVEAEAVKRLQDANEVWSSSASVQDADELPTPVRLRVRTIGFPVVATY